jgi:hypothetical protein
MKLQIIQDGKGKATGVYIPMSQWKLLKRRYKELAAMEAEEHSKDQVLYELTEAINELREIESGKLKTRPAKELLDEL